MTLGNSDLFRGLKLFPNTEIGQIRRFWMCTKEKSAMESYLIRVYRRSKDAPEKIVGIIENIDSGLTQSFKNLTELCNAITTTIQNASSNTTKEAPDDTPKK